MSTGACHLLSTGSVAAQVTNGWLSLLVSGALGSREVGGEADPVSFVIHISALAELFPRVSFFPNVSS